MKLFIKKLFILLVLLASLTIVPGYILDPYNVFHWDNMRENGVEANGNYIKMKYLLSVPEKYDTFMFGSSRVGVIHTEKLKNVKPYNMTCSVGVPREHLNNIKTLLKNEIKIKRIYVGVDEISFETNEKSHREPMRCSYEYLTQSPDVFFRFYANPVMLYKSLRHYKWQNQNQKQNNVTDVNQVYKNGWWADYNQEFNYDWNKEVKIVRKTDNETSDNAELIAYEINKKDSLDAIKEIKKICQKNNIELIVFTNPVNKNIYIRSLNMGYLSFLKELSKITDFYNFTGLNDISKNNSNFINPGHYNAQIGDMIMEVLDNNKRYEGLYEKGFGWHVTESNVDELINLIDVKPEMGS